MDRPYPCLACDLVEGRRIAPGGIIFENEHWQVDHVNHPVLLKGMLIVRLKRHCEVFATITRAEATSLGETLQRASAGLHALLQPERIYIGLFGESLRHVHFFVIPRMRGMPAGSWGTFTWLRLQGVLHQLKLRKPYLPDEIEQFTAALKMHYSEVGSG